MSIKSVMPSSHLILCHLFLLLPPIPPASESFPMSQIFTWGGQSIGISSSSHTLKRQKETGRTYFNIVFCLIQKYPNYYHSTYNQYKILMRYFTLIFEPSLQRNLVYILYSQHVLVQTSHISRVTTCGYHLGSSHISIKTHIKHSSLIQDKN